MPVAATHSPVASADVETTDDIVTRTVVGTVIVTLTPLASSTVTEVPFTPLAAT